MRLLAALLCVTTSAASRHSVHGNWQHRDDFVTALDEALVVVVGAAAQEHQVVIAAAQQNLDALATLTLAVSDPASAAYGKHLTYDQVHTMTSNAEATRAIKAWCAAEEGITVTGTSSHGEYITARASRATWDRVLGSRLIKMRHVVTGHSVFRSRRFTMPTAIRS